MNMNIKYFLNKMTIILTIDFVFQLMIEQRMKFYSENKLQFELIWIE